jgi:hypothetical protein
MPRTLYLLLVATGTVACAPWEQAENYYADWNPPSVSGLSATSEEGNLGGATITISGSGFGTDPSQIVIQFGDENAEIVSLEDGAATVKVPAGPITGGPVDVRVATATGFTTASDPYTYDLGSQYEDQVGYVQVNNFWESCYGGLSDRLDDTYGATGCTSIAYIGYTGIDGEAEALTFKYPRMHAQNIGFYGGADHGNRDWVIERPGQINYVFGVDDLHKDIGEVVLHNDVWDGEAWCPDLDSLAAYRYGGGVAADGDGADRVYDPVDISVSTVVDGSSCDVGDAGSYDMSELHFCTAPPEADAAPDYVYSPDWPVPKNFFAGKRNDYTKPTALDFTASKVGIDALGLTLPESVVLYNDEGMDPVIEGAEGAADLWSLSSPQGCFDDSGGSESLDDVAFRFSWVPSDVDYPDVSDSCGVGEVCAVQTYVRMTLTEININWFGPTAYPVRATMVVPDRHAFDDSLGDAGRSTLEIPASVLYQFPTVELPQATGIGGGGLLESTVSDYGYLIVTFERVTDYTIGSSAGGTVVFSYTTGDFGFLGWDNPTDADACHNCLDDDGDGWADADDPDCASGGTAETGYGDDACNDNVDNDGDGRRDAGDSLCETGAGTDESNCSNGQDDDDDGFEDADDPDCIAGGNEGDTTAPTGCTDGLDGDGDGWIDLADPDCATGDDELGYGATACNDGIDNDGDGFADDLDTECADALDDDEGVAAPTGCANGLDDDADGWADLDDPDCTSGTEELGLGTTACNDGADNDGDGFADDLDADCLTGLDDDEGGASLGGCVDGLDNDGDGWSDLDDPDCAGGVDEVGLGTAACNDGADNDGDTLFDAEDPECADAADGDEGS